MQQPWRSLRSQSALVITVVIFRQEGYVMFFIGLFVC